MPDSPSADLFKLACHCRFAGSCVFTGDQQFLSFVALEEASNCARQKLRSSDDAF